ncbi:hypothetical protein N7457_002334 [Penicillium paradoxum]|uniref:uncharacterized protein n=1 Tax=Penicillium paradoxum TaxID=176176 RepID=UPI0025480DFD|nr:uncharacterized protein N7457_002334 [Penicillium paradoxum]KAJ5787344.1 hypothetical protein N7457_002334 [Penicillium paradoxum]
MSSPAQPSISTKLAITPAKLSLGISSSTITLTATLHYTEPITIFKHGTIFNLALNHSPSNFDCEDITTENAEPINIGIKKGCKRPAFSREYGGRDDRFFVTLYPETPILFEGVFHLAKRSCQHVVFQPRHKYRFATKQGETVDWWRVGEKKNAMTSPGEFAVLGEASGSPISLGMQEVELEVL